MPAVRTFQTGDVSTKMISYVPHCCELCALWQQDRRGRFIGRRLPDAVQRVEEVFSSELGWVLVPYQASKVLAL